MQAIDIASDPIPFMKALWRGRHWVGVPNSRCAIIKESIAINCDWVNNGACSLSHIFYPIFITVNKLCELFQKIRFPSIFSTFVYHYIFHQHIVPLINFWRLTKFKITRAQHDPRLIDFLKSPKEQVSFLSPWALVQSWSFCIPWVRVVQVFLMILFLH